MKKHQNDKNKILWAFNPFQDKLPHLKNALAALLQFCRQAQWSAEPVYVVNPTEVNVVLEFSVPAKERYRKVASEKAQKVLETLRAEDMKPTVLVEKSMSLTASAKALASYADRQGATAILTSIRSKKSLVESLLGSFAETLLHHAACPVLLVHPGAKVKAHRRLLFVTDLSPDSFNVFKNYCRLASSLGAEVHLFHSIPRPFSWASFAVDSLLGPDRLSERQYLILTRKLRENDLKPFAEAAKSHRVPFSSHIAIGGSDVADDALKEAKKRKVDMIGMAGKSGRLKTRLLGSVTRSLLRQTKLPVWIQHLR